MTFDEPHMAQKLAKSIIYKTSVFTLLIIFVYTII